MTIIETIRAEIVRLIDEYKPIVGGVDELTGAHIVLAKILSFLDTLESEKPIEQEGLEEEINRYLEPIHAADIQFEPFTQMTKCARHFAQWGAEHLASARKTSPKDLEEAAIEWSKIFVKDECKDACHYGFLTGAKWQADHTPLPEDTALFNKGVAEGKRLMMEEWLKDRDGCFWDGVEEGKKAIKDAILSLIESRISEIIGDAQPRPALRAELEELIKRIKED